MTNVTQTFTIADPRTFDGDPFEVAERAAAQAEAVAAIMEQCLSDARVMARNAQMERDLIATGDCYAPDYDDSPEGKKFAEIIESSAYMQKQLRLLKRAAAFNPKAPLSAGS